VEIRKKNSSSLRAKRSNPFVFSFGLRPYNIFLLILFRRFTAYNNFFLDCFGLRPRNDVAGSESRSRHCERSEAIQPPRHCEPRSGVAIHFFLLLDCFGLRPRNDGVGFALRVTQPTKKPDKSLRLVGFKKKRLD
jgi:hypothetical protein